MTQSREHSHWVEVDRLKAENKRLRAEVAQLGEMANVCTYNALGAVCSNCRCGRRTD
jgi:hypothetical protein